MSKKDVEEVLIIAALNRLLTLTHLVKEPILIAKSRLLVGNIKYEYHLHLTENGLKRYIVKPKKYLLPDTLPFSTIIELYKLTRTKLEQLYKDLNEQTGS